MKKFLLNKLSQFLETSEDYLFVPTNSKPFVLWNFHFYGDRISADGANYFYNDLISIKHNVSSISVNFSSTVKYEFVLFFDIGENSFPLELRAKKNTVTFNIKNPSKKELHKLNFISNVLMQSTFNLRLMRYQNMFANYGYIHYPNGFKLYENGTIMHNESVSNVNILHAINHSDYSYGTSSQRQTLRTSSSKSNPYELTLRESSNKKSASLLGFKFRDSETLNLFYDKDVFEKIYGKGKYLGRLF